MEKNKGSNFILFLTLFTFGFGLILYIFLKRRNSAEILLEKPIEKDEPIPSQLTEREEIIMNEMINKEKVYPSDIYDLLPEVSTRTIRRDMTKLVDKGLIKQLGSTKSTYYKYIKN